MFEKLFKKNKVIDVDVVDANSPTVEVVEKEGIADKARESSADLLVVNDNAVEKALEEIKEEAIPQKFTPPQLTHKEAKALKKARYEEVMENPKFKNSYVLMNAKTGQIVDIKAASSFHACNIIGWKPKQVKVLAVNSLEKKIEESSTIDK